MISDSMQIRQILFPAFPLPKRTRKTYFSKPHGAGTFYPTTGSCSPFAACEQSQRTCLGERHPRSPCAGWDDLRGLVGGGCDGCVGAVDRYLGGMKAWEDGGSSVSVGDR